MSGFAIVPREPTSEMLMAAQDADISTGWEQARECWEAMIAAAPGAPVPDLVSVKAVDLAKAAIPHEFLPPKDVAQMERRFKKSQEAIDHLTQYLRETPLVTRDSALAMAQHVLETIRGADDE